MVDFTAEDGMRHRCRLPDFIQLYICICSALGNPIWQRSCATKCNPGNIFIGIGADRLLGA